MCVPECVCVPVCLCVCVCVDLRYGGGTNRLGGRAVPYATHQVSTLNPRPQPLTNRLGARAVAPYATHQVSTLNLKP